MVRVRMSARVYPPQVGTAQTLGVRVRYPAPWAQASTEFRKQWKIVVQEVEKPRVHQALRAKRDKAVCMLWGIVLGCGWLKDELVNKNLCYRWLERNKHQKGRPNHRECLRPGSPFLLIMPLPVLQVLLPADPQPRQPLMMEGNDHGAR